MQVKTSTGEIIEYSIFEGEVPNEEYFIIRKSDNSKGCILSMIKNFNFLISKKVEGTEYTVDYVAVDLNPLTVWQEPLYI